MKRRSKVGIEYSSAHYCKTILNRDDSSEDYLETEIGEQLKFLRIDHDFKIADVIAGYDIMRDISVDYAEMGLDSDMHCLECYEGTLCEVSENK